MSYRRILRIEIAITEGPRRGRGGRCRSRVSRSRRTSEGARPASPPAAWVWAPASRPPSLPRRGPPPRPSGRNGASLTGPWGRISRFPPPPPPRPKAYIDPASSNGPRPGGLAVYDLGLSSRVLGFQSRPGRPSRTILARFGWDLGVAY